MPTKEELEDRITELEDENQTLNDKLDSILDIAGAEDEDDSARISTLVSVLLTIGWPRTPLFIRVGKHSRR